jgi:hypothetical protein
MKSQKVKNRTFLSFPRRRESSFSQLFWTPACAGVTTWGTFYRENALCSAARRAGDLACQVGTVADPTFSCAGATRCLCHERYERIKLAALIFQRTTVNGQRTTGSIFSLALHCEYAIVINPKFPFGSLVHG